MTAAIMLSIVHIASGDLWAGAESQLYHLVSTLNKTQNVNVKVILYNNGELEKRLMDAGVSVIVIPETVYSALDLFLKTRRCIKNVAPDIVHTHGYKVNILGSFSSIGHRKSIALLKTIHGSPEFNYTWKQLQGKLSSTLDVWSGKLFNKKIITVSSHLNPLYSQYYNPSKIVTIENGINIVELDQLAQEQTMPLPGYSNSIKIGLIGRMVPVKRMDLFIEAAEIVIQHINAQANMPKVEFYIFGDGPLNNEISQQAKNSTAHHAIHLMGFKTNLINYVKQLDIITITSDHEGLPMNLLEAMALGVHVVSRAVGGIPYVLDQGQCGKLVHTENPEDIAQAIIHYMKEPDSHKEQKQLARQRIEEHFHTDAISQRYLEVYKVLVNKSESCT